MKNYTGVFLFGLFLFAACTQSAKNSDTVKMDTVPIYDLNGNVLRDTLIHHVESSVSVSKPKMDTVPIYDLKGNHVGDTLIERKN